MLVRTPGTLRRPRLKRKTLPSASAPGDKDRLDYTVFTGEWEIGYQTRGGPEYLRWFWFMSANGPMTHSDRVATLEEAQAQVRKCWDAWKVWPKLEEVD